MKKLAHVAANELLLLTKDKMALIWMIILPVGLTALMGLVFGNLGGESGPIAMDLPIVDLDGGEMASAVLDILSRTQNLNLETQYDAQAAQELVEEGDRAGALIIPTGFTTDVTSGIPTSLKLIVAPNNQTAPMLEGMVRGITSGFSSVQTTIKITIAEVQRATGSDDIDYEGLTGRVAEASQASLKDPPVKTQITSVKAQEIDFNSFDQVVPGYAIMFAMFGVLGNAGSILVEKEQGTFKRLLMAPLPKYALLGGKLLAQFAIGVIQIGLMFAFGALVFGVHLGRSIPALVLITLATCWATTSLGLLLVAVVKSRRQLSPITTMVILGSAAIGGSWYPLFLMPRWIQQAARVTVNAWSMEAYNRLMMFDAGLSDVWLNIVALLAYGAICFLLGLRLFKFKEA